MVSFFIYTDNYIKEKELYIQTFNFEEKSFTETNFVDYVQEKSCNMLNDSHSNTSYSTIDNNSLILLDIVIDQGNQILFDNFYVCA